MTATGPDRPHPGGDGPEPRTPGRGRRGPGQLDLRNTWQVVAGAVLLPLGIAVILLAWYGSAHTPYVQQQIPYLVSGSFIGLGLMVVGGLLYWAHWLYRIYDQSALQHQELLGQQGELLAALREVAPPGGGRPAVGANGARPDADRSRAVLMATANGSTFHQAGCPVLENRRATARPVDPARLGGLKPCRICEPTL
ncbi:MAG TPA: hypothetical protein VE990_18340 [Acidimicrobiales bacterium]|nr:hypothetical protein [Acidimicrobiales bacterium]